MCTFRTPIVSRVPKQHVTDRETFENSEDVQHVEGCVNGQVDESVLDDPMGGVEVVGVY